MGFLIYDENERRTSGPPPSGLDPNAQFSKHLDNWFFLKLIIINGQRLDRWQATKEILICERKLEFWQRKPNFNKEIGILSIQAAKKTWKLEEEYKLK